jgi:archaeal flagellar protein FlaJ
MTMLLLLFFFGLLLTLGLYFLLANLLKLPTLGATKALLNVNGRKKKASKGLEALLYSYAVKLAKFIHMDKYKRNRMCVMLKAADIPMTPEIYTASVTIRTG